MADSDIIDIGRTQTFFRLLRQANWSTMPWERGLDDPGRFFYNFVRANPRPIYISKLYDRHQARLIGVFPHTNPMGATICPSDEAAMKATFEGEGWELLPQHMLGSTITGTGLSAGESGKERHFAQLGMVMIASEDTTEWHMTDFVFATDLNQRGYAMQLWIFHNPAFGDWHADEDPLAFMPERYTKFNLSDISGLVPHHFGHQQALQVWPSGNQHWRRRTRDLEEDGDGGLELASLRWVTHREHLHFTRLAQNIDGRHFEHATAVLNNPPGTQATLSQYPGPYWICLWDEHRQEDGCPEIPTGDGPLRQQLQQWQQWEQWKQRQQVQQLQQILQHFRQYLQEQLWQQGHRWPHLQPFLQHFQHHLQEKLWQLWQRWQLWPEWPWPEWQPE